MEVDVVVGGASVLVAARGGDVTVGVDLAHATRTSKPSVKLIMLSIVICRRIFLLLSSSLVLVSRHSML
jgi:hypothetical protein